MASTPRHSLGHWIENPGAGSDEPRVTVDWGIEIEEDEANQLVNAVSAVRRLTERGTYEHLCRCYMAVTDRVSLYRSLRQTTGNARALNQRSHSTSVMGAVANWLSASRMYLVSELDTLRELAGDDGAAVERLETERSRVFDTNLGYRFLYNLRDYAQHTGPPLSSIHVGRTADGGSEATLLLDRSRLLAARFNWKKSSLAFLRESEAPISLVPLLDEAMDGYAEIERQNLRELLRFAQAATPLLRDAYARSQWPEGAAPAVVRWEPQDDGGMTFSMQPLIPPEVLDQLESVFGLSDPLSGLPTSELLPPPPQAPETADAIDKVVAVMAAWRTSDTTLMVDQVNAVLAEPAGLDALINGFVSLSGQLLHIAALGLGNDPDALLGSMSSAGRDAWAKASLAQGSKHDPGTDN